MPKQEKFDLDPTSRTYVGRHPKELDKHNLRDALSLIETVQKYYLAGETVSTDRLLASAKILRAAAERLDREVSLRTGK